MAAVELWRGSARERVVELVEQTYMIGSDPGSADVVIDDPTVSALHACVERVGNTWLVRDLGSLNGTFVEGQRLTGQRRLRPTDAIRVGQSRLVFTDRAATRRPVTDTLAGPPRNLTPTERRVLIELCRPLLSHNAFQPPASVREIAARLYVGRNAVQAHLTNLYDKFDIRDEADSNRRTTLANKAIERGAVSRGDLEDPSADDTDPGSDA
jgi:hypothetical protein